MSTVPDRLLESLLRGAGEDGRIPFERLQRWFPAGARQLLEELALLDAQGRVSCQGLVAFLFPSGAALAAPDRLPGCRRLSPEEYIDRLQRGEAGVRLEQLEGLKGRFCYGNQPGDFLRLGHPCAKTCFIFGADGLQLLLNIASQENRKECGGPYRPSLPMELLMKIGYDVLYIYDNIRQGRVTDLVVFPEGSVRFEPATWSGTAALIAERPRGIGAFPQAAAVLAGHAAELRRNGAQPFNPAGYQELEHEFGLHVDDPDVAGYKFDKSMPWIRNARPMTAEKLGLLGAAARPCHSRAFLYHYCGMNSLFGGDGLTVPDGSVRYVHVRNCADLHELPLRWSSEGLPPRLEAPAGELQQGDFLVRLRLDAPDAVPQFIARKEDLPASGAARLTVLGAGSLREFIAENVLRGEVQGLRSTPIGSPQLEACCQTIVALLEAQQGRAAAQGQADGGVDIWSGEGPEGVDRGTGERLAGRPRPMTPCEFAELFMAGGRLPEGEKLQGVGWRFRAFNNPAAANQLAYVDGPNIGRSVAMAPPDLAQMLLELPQDERTALHIQLQIGVPPTKIYSHATQGFGLSLEVIKWEPWTPGEDPCTCSHFPSTPEGIRAFVCKCFPRILESFDRHIGDILNGEDDEDGKVVRASTDATTRSEGESGEPMSAARLEELQSRGQVTAAHVRSFLVDTLSLSGWAGEAAFYTVARDSTQYVYYGMNEHITELRRRPGVLCTVPLASPSPEAVMQHISAMYKDLRDNQY